MASLMIQPLVDKSTGQRFLGFHFTSDEASFNQLIPWTSVEAAEKLAADIRDNIIKASDELMRDQLGLIIAPSLPEKDK